MMDTLFAQSITQFANLRTYARACKFPFTSCENARIIRELFPKALFDERQMTHEHVFGIMWSFLSPGEEGRWAIEEKYHRIGGLPAVIYTCRSHEWWQNGQHHRDDCDPRTGLTLPAIIYADGSQEWRISGQHHRDEKDPNTGLILPAIIYTHRWSEYWINNVQIC